MNKKGYERNSLFSERFKTSLRTLRAYRFRDLRSGNKKFAEERKKIYARIEKLLRRE